MTSLSGVGVWGCLLVLVWLSVVVDPSAALELGQSCVNPHGQPGSCIHFNQCQPVLKVYQKRVNTPDEASFLTNSRCGVQQRSLLVCCAVAKPASLPVAPECGFQLSDRVFGGQETQLDEFPWMALIEYEIPGAQNGFYCGGTLINKRYIVTAAHCVDSLPRGRKVRRVRLGEWDLTSAIDCNDEFCADAPQDLDIETIVTHPGYDSHNSDHVNDIALIRLNRDVTVSETVRPICLPLSESQRSRNHTGTLGFAAGWGRTETARASEKKLKVELNVTSFQSCSKVFQRADIALQPTQMCAGGIRGKDTCSGDSGGPLMRLFTGSWYLIGVVSFGTAHCGTERIPGVYTNVAEYVDWIRDNVY